jgi:hypothetical protein
MLVGFVFLLHAQVHRGMEIYANVWINQRICI